MKKPTDKQMDKWIKAGQWDKVLIGIGKRNPVDPALFDLKPSSNGKKN